MAGDAKEPTDGGFSRVTESVGAFEGDGEGLGREVGGQFWFAGAAREEREDDRFVAPVQLAEGVGLTRSVAEELAVGTAGPR